METELISVIIPMYNVKPYIKGCVCSVTGGEYRNIEVICVDDGSTDGTADVVKKLQEDDARIKLCQQENAGPSAARNRGLKEAKGTYIAFIDADDWVTSDYLSVMHEVACEKNAQIVNCGFWGVRKAIWEQVIVDKAEYQVVKIPEKDKNRELVNHVWRALYQKKICPLFNESVNIGEDQLFNIRILSEHLNINAWKCTKRMYFHIWRSGSLLSSIGIERYHYICRDILKELDSLPVSKYAIIGAIKEALAFRYFAENSNNQKKHDRQASDLIKKVMRLLLHCREMLFYEKVVYLFFLCFPFLYKVHRDQLLRRK